VVFWCPHVAVAVAVVAVFWCRHAVVVAVARHRRASVAVGRFRQGLWAPCAERWLAAPWADASVARR
jgi:hypothetical protein